MLSGGSAGSTLLRMHNLDLFMHILGPGPGLPQRVDCALRKAGILHAGPPG